MRRSIIDYRPIVPILLVVGLVLFESITSLFTFVSPLMGVVFLYLVTNIKDKEKLNINIVLLLYLLYVEVDRGFIVFSSLMVFIIFYEFVYNDLVSSIGCKKCLKAVIIVIFYFMFYTINLIISLIFDLNLPVLDITYLVYMITDIVLVILL